MEGIEREPFEDVLACLAEDRLVQIAERALPPGWKHVYEKGTKRVDLGLRQLLVADEEKAADLLSKANADHVAFDALSFFAAGAIAHGAVLPPSLREFAAKALIGEVRRPPAKGRPAGRDAYLKAMIYDLVCHAREIAPVMRLGRNDAAPDGTFCIFEAVAQAFTKAGKRTTYMNVKSIYHDESYSDVRRLGDYLGGRQTLEAGWLY